MDQTDDSGRRLVEPGVNDSPDRGVLHALEDGPSTRQRGVQTAGGQTEGRRRGIPLISTGERVPGVHILGVQDQAAQHSPGGPVVETAIQNHAAADSSAVGDTEIVPYTLGGAIGPLSERRRADIVEDDGGDMEPRLKESLYIHAGIARQVFVGVSDDPGTWHRPCGPRYPLRPSEWGPPPQKGRP